MKVAFGVFGIVVSIVSAMFVAMAISDLVGGDGDTSRSTLVGLLALFLGAGFWGLNLARNAFGWRLPGVRLPRLRSDTEREKAVLAYAVAAGGRVTVIEVAGSCGFGIEESKRILDRFVVNAAAELLVADDGTLVYDFNVLSAREKARAQGMS
jgi:hypothetical protein